MPEATCRKCRSPAMFSHVEVYPTGMVYDVFECDEPSCPTNVEDGDRSFGMRSKDVDASLAAVKCTRNRPQGGRD